MSEETTRIHDDAAALAADVASAVLARVEELQAGQDVVHVGLTGGSIAEAIHQELGRRAPDSAVQWDRTVFWWGDERYVAPDSEDRNGAAARRDFLAPAGVPERNVREMASDADAATPEEAAARYEEALRRDWDGFDLLMLGLGPDGHIASLFPGRPELSEQEALAVAVHDSPKPPPLRVSLTYPVLRRSDAVWFLVSGEDKAEAVAAARQDGPLEECPGRGVRGRTETVWWLDRDSASRLEE